MPVKAAAKSCLKGTVRILILGTCIYFSYYGTGYADPEDGVSVPVTGGAYSHEVDVSSIGVINITATGASGETVTRTIEIK